MSSSKTKKSDTITKPIEYDSMIEGFLKKKKPSKSKKSKKYIDDEDDEYFFPDVVEKKPKEPKEIEHDLMVEGLLKTKLPTIMTIVIKIDCYINRSKIFSLLPIKRINLDQNIVMKKSGKYEIPWPGEQGHILSVTSGQYVRGIRKKDNQKSFRNSVMLIISIEDEDETEDKKRFKNIDIKIFKKVLHICGCQKIKQGENAVGLFFAILEFLQDKLNWIYNNKVKYLKCLECIERITKGVLKKSKKGEKYYDIKYYETEEIEEFARKKKFPLDIFKLLISYSYDYENHEDYICFLKSIVDLGNIYDGNLEILELKTPMVNYNYGLAYEIDRLDLQKAIKEYPEFHVFYNNMIHTHAKIILPIELQNNEVLHISEFDRNDKAKITTYMEEFHLDNKKRKKYKFIGEKRILRHSFLIYRSGKITQSSPNPIDAQIGYEKLRQLISIIEPKINKVE